MEDPQNAKFVSPVFDDKDPNYSTVSGAIDAADSGSVIVIFPGTYAEIISTTKRLHIVGVNKNSCVIAKAANANQDVFTIDGSGGGVFSISNLTISQTNSTGGEALHINDSFDGNAYLTNLILLASNEEALQINNASSVFINSCDLIGSGAGLYMANNVPSAVYKVEVRNSRIEATRYAGTSANGGQSLYCQACVLKGGLDTSASTSSIYLGAVKSMPVLDSCTLIAGTNAPAIFYANAGVVGVKVFNCKLVKNGTAIHTVTGNWPLNGGASIAAALCAMNAGIDTSRINNLSGSPNNVIDSDVS